MCVCIGMPSSWSPVKCWWCQLHWPWLKACNNFSFPLLSCTARNVIDFFTSHSVASAATLCHVASMQHSHF